MLEDRWDQWAYYCPLLVINATDCIIKESHNTTWVQKTEFCSLKTHKPSLRYLVRVNCKTRCIVFCTQAFPAGKSEIVIVKQELISLLDSGEQVLGDKLYCNAAFMQL